MKEVLEKGGDGDHLVVSCFAALDLQVLKT